MSREKFYVTTPIYYVNDRPHIGHAYTTILADILARYHRLLNIPAHFLTGTDEHGQKVQEAAQKNQISAQEQCDRTVVRFQELWQTLEITNDDFIRTTEERHTRVVQHILQDLYDRGEIYASDYEGWYCVPCERFFTEKDLIEKKCPECTRAVERLVERNYFFRMSKYQDWLVDYIETHPQFILPEHRRQETLGFLKSPLNDLCISRPKSRLNWGIELPFDRDYVTYVWFDALVNYISAIGYPFDMERFRHWWPVNYHLIGKDILTTHTVYWPTMLKAIGIEMPETIFAHGWWLVGRNKMSKSIGNVVNPMEMIERYGVDPFRYFLLAEMTLGQDASFTEEIFVNRYNADLANDLGNMASRVIKMVRRNLNGTFAQTYEAGPDEKSLVDATLAAVANMKKYLENMQLDRGIECVLEAVREGNRYFDKMAPWTLAKQGETEKLERVLYSSAECLRIVAGLLYPVMPGKMKLLRQALGLPEEEVAPHVEKLAKWGRLQPNRPLIDIKSLFPRIDVKKQPDTEKKDKPQKKKSTETTSGANAKAEIQVDINDLSRVNLRTAKVLAAERVKGSDKLLKLQIKIGDEERQIVAGIGKHYQPESVLGRTIIVVANMKPAKVFGVESNGMLFAAKSGNELRLLTVDGEIADGAEIS